MELVEPVRDVSLPSQRDTTYAKQRNRQPLLSFWKSQI